LSEAHKRICEIVDQPKDVREKWTRSLLRRIPVEFTPTGPAHTTQKLLPLVVARYIPFPRMVGATLHLINNISNQLRPTSITNQAATGVVQEYPEHFERETGYPSRTWRNCGPR
jgi:hypothetical protein